MSFINTSELIITVVEPSIMQGKVILKKLNELGATKIQYYPSGEIALEMIEKFQPDLVISAMYLNDMTAEELVTKMRNNPNLAKTPFLLISSESSFAALDPIKQAGTVAVLPKPFELEDLKNALYATTEILSVDNEFIEAFDWEDLDVLVVDDSALARKHITNLLQAIGIEKITYAENGQDAIKHIDEKFFDLILTDFNMPKMDGHALTNYIREKSNQQSVPILMITSEQNENRLAAVSKAGVSGICDKPFRPDVFKQLLISLFVNQ